MTIGDLTLNMIGNNVVRTEYEGATIEGLLTGLDLTVETTAIRNLQRKGERDQYEVVVDLTLGRIELHGLTRDHACEVTA